MHYNPYFPGGWISMARSLYNEVVEYDDGELMVIIFVGYIFGGFNVRESIYIYIYPSTYQPTHPPTLNTYLSQSTNPPTQSSIYQ